MPSLSTWGPRAPLTVKIFLEFVTFALTPGLLDNDKDAYGLVECRLSHPDGGDCARRGAETRPDAARVRSRLLALERHGREFPRRPHQEVSAADRPLRG